MSSIRTIILKRGNPDGTIQLSGRTTAWKDDFIKWKIRSSSGISSIERIEKKEGSSEIFREPPHANGRDWSAEVSHDVEEGSVYNYSIFWKDETGTTREFDPIISIRPRALIEQTYLAPIATFALGLLASFIYWRQERMKLKRQIETLEKHKIK